MSLEPGGKLYLLLFASDSIKAFKFFLKILTFSPLVSSLAFLSELGHSKYATPSYRSLIL